MLNSIIRFSLRHRVLVAAASLVLLLFGGWQIRENVTIDVFPSLDRPRVAIMTEAHGMAPEEVEALITFPLETALNGATGVQAVRTKSAPGFSQIYVEFDYGTDIYTCRQIVNERMAMVTDRLPPGITPQLAPISSVMGQIMIIGMWSDKRVDEGGTSPMEMRTLADWVVRQRLRQSVKGIAQIFVMGGDRKQFQVLVNPESLIDKRVSLHEVETALAESNGNATGGYLDQQGAMELMVRSIGRIQSVEDVEKIVVNGQRQPPVTLGQVARVIEGAQVKRGDSTAFIRDKEGEFTGGQAVLLTITKQPSADTRTVTENIVKELKKIETRLPDDVHIYPNLYQQRSFIDRAVENVAEALRDGGILVVVILFMFLMSFRTTFVTLTAIPLSIIITGLVFTWFDLSINTMTLGGLAIAIGELVDDAIVDVENIFRRLRENRHSDEPKPALLVVYQASCEIRNSIVFGTLIVCMVFIPVFGLTGMEGRLFRPLGLAYIISILSSLLVSLTLTPVLSYWLLSPKYLHREDKDTFVLRFLKWIAGSTIRFSLKAPFAVIGAAVLCAALAGVVMYQLDRDFLPPFNEGATQINVVLDPGVSLETSVKTARAVEKVLKKNDDILTFVRKTGRAELDEHAVPVNFTEIIATIDPNSPRSRTEIVDRLRKDTKTIPGVIVAVEQPLQHLISHMLSGVQSQVAIKLYGPNLEVLRQKGVAMEDAIRDIKGVVDLRLEPQKDIPQLQIRINRDRLETFGLRCQDINEFVETAMQGHVVDEVLIDQRTFDLMVRLDEPFREDIETVKRLSIDLPGGGTTMLQNVAEIDDEAVGPNVINREQAQRRIVLQCNVSGRGMVDVVEDIKQRLAKIKFPGNDYHIEYGGQFESQQSATRTMAVLFAVSLAGMFLVLYTMFGSANLSLQVMFALPAAFIGSVAALVITGQTLTVAAMIGFISLCGIASRNGILLINHYLHLVEHENETWSKEMVVRAGRERVAPVLMTALTSGVGLIPLAIAAGQPGKEILYPVATVIIGGLITSTALEFFVRPALFWKVGIGAAKRVAEQSREEIVLEEEA